MVKRLFALLLFLLALNPIPAAAQQEVVIGALNVALWPEFDRPQMLVIYKINWSPAMSLPAEVTLRIPAAAGEPHAVAERELDGGLYNVAYERTVQGEWALITFTTATPEAQLEYYDPGLVKEAADRRFTYEWLGDYQVSALSVQVQEPAGAQGLQINPGLGGGTLGSDGLVYYNAELGPRQAGEAFQLQLNYRKDTDALSVEIVDLLQVQPSDPLSPDTQGRVTLTDVLPWLLGILGGFLIIGGVLWFLRNGQPLVRTQPAGSRTRRGRRAASPVMESREKEGGVFCHQCGKRAAPGDRFCRACGTRLRIEET